MKYSSALLISLIVLFSWSCDLDQYIEGEDRLINLIPETAVLGVISTDIAQMNSKLSQNEFIRSGLTELLSLQQAGFLLPDSLEQMEANFSEAVYSWHSVSGSELAPLVLLKKKEQWSWAEWESRLGQFLGANGISSEVKLFDDFEIRTTQVINTKIVWLLHDNIIALSTSELLLEDLVRSINGIQFRLIGDQNTQATGTKVFLNGARQNELLGKFRSESVSSPYKDKVLLLDFEADENSVRFTGESIQDGNVSGVNELLFGQSFIPLSSESLKWQLNEGGGTLVAPFYASIKFTVFDSNEQLFIFQVKDESALEMDLSTKATDLLKQGDSTVYMEGYASQTIGFIGDDYFTSMASGHNDYLNEGAFYCLVEDVMLVSPSADVLRMSLAAHFDESTYGQSVKESVFMNDLIQDTYYTSITDFNSLSNQDGPNSPYNELIKTWRQGLSTSVFQLNTTSKSYLASGILTFEEVNRNEVLQDHSETLIANAFLDTAALSRIHIVKNHNTNQQEMLVQDIDFQLYQIDLQGEVKWKVDLDGRTIGKVLQVDYYNNRKLQYLVVTDSLLHIIDRNGESIEGFPKAHGIDKDINGVELVDYDNTKRYRYLISAGRGEIYLYDKEARLLEGWSPVKVDALLKNIPYHDRVAGKDFFIAAEQSNRLHLLNRRGEEYQGFPVELNQRFSGDHYFKKSPNMMGSELIVISDDGLLSSVNLLGRVTQQKQFLKERNEDAFRLVNDVSSSGFVVLKEGLNSTEVLDSNENVLFEMPLLGDTDEVSYYRITDGRSVLMVWHKNTGSLDIYNANGKKLSKAITTDQKPALLYFSREGNYQLFTILNNQIRIHQLQALD